MRVALRAEAEKAVTSVVVRSTTACVVLGILVLSTAMCLAAERGNAQVAAKVGPLADEEGWTLLVGVVSMIAAPGCLLGFGVVLSWMVGREFADGTVSGLFGLPVSRRTLAAAKLGAFVVWACSAALALTVGTGLVGLSLGYGTPAADDAAALGRLLAVGASTGLLALPAGWASTAGRGVLPGIAVSIGLIALAQVLVVAGTGAWFPVAAPALWAISPEDVSWVQLATVPALAASIAVLTVVSWHRLQLDR
jgi:ABC-2 type transport system permease protein